MDYRENKDVGNLFSKFWSDWTTQMAGMGFSPPAEPSREAVLRQMRQAFFDAWARACEDFLGSEQFLESMKKSMDGALAFRQQLNEFMTRVLHESQIPARSDADSIMLVLHGLEERMAAKLDQLAARVASLENGASPAHGQAQPGEASGRPVRPTPKKGKSR